MIVITDSNILFSALISPNGAINKILKSKSNLQFFAPSYLFEEVNNHSVITVKDYGIGIPEAELPLVFESFFRSTNADNIPGTGLGMSIIKLFVEMNGGTVNIESKIDKGTSLIITLPSAI
jgi:signal transduction histidine kinase